MIQFDFVNTLQFLLILFFIVFITYSIVHISVNRRYCFSVEEVSFDINLIFQYVKQLYVLNYECYHKYQIWRYFLFN